jgi:hypothetical protein
MKEGRGHGCRYRPRGGRAASDCPSGCGSLARRAILRFTETPNQWLNSSRPASMRGAFRDRHGRWVRDAMDAAAAQDGRRLLRTAKSCGPDAPTLASSSRGRLRGRWWQESPVTRESAKETVKTIARGMPGDFRCDLTNACAFYRYHCTRGNRAHRAPGIPCALSLVEGERFRQNSRGMRGEIAKLYL